MPRAVRGVVAGCGTLVVCTLLVTSGFAQLGTDPRNSDEYYAAVAGVNCWDCHAPTVYHYEPALFYVETRYTEVPVGETVDIVVMIRHIMSVPRPAGLSKMTHAMQKMAVTLYKAGAPSVEVITEDFVEDLDDADDVRVDADERATRAFLVEAGASEVRARAYVRDPGPAFGAAGESLRLELVSPLDDRYGDTGTASDRAVALGPKDVERSGSGEYVLVVSYAHPAPGLAGPLDVALEWVVDYEQTQTAFRFEVPGGDIRGADPIDRLSRTVTIPIRLTSADEAFLDFQLEVENYWLHDAADDAPGDEGTFYRFDTLRIRGGEEYVVAAGLVEAPVPPASVDLQHLLTRILGFVSLLLVPVAMVTGGVFGKESRRVLNRLTGGAKKRVLWHNAMSFAIIGVASVHFLLALVDGASDWTRGLLWGGTGWAVLVSLGFTGYYQVQIIKRWDYAFWRRVHLSSALGVLLFGLVHMALEGGDLGFLRDLLPGWHERLVWP